MSVDFENKVPFGKKADDRLYDVDEVENGRACDCHCPYCGVLLVAKHGDVNRHHFAHYGAPSCEYGFEAGVRLAVKEVLDRRRQIRLPAVVMDFGENLRDVTIRPEQVVELDDVALVDEGTRLPDLVVGCGGRRLYIDVQLTKGMNSNRLQALRDQGIGVLQLSMSHLDVEVRMKDVEELVVDSLTSKNWLSHYKVLKGRDWIEKRTEHMRVWQGRNYVSFVRNCPKKGEGKSASVDRECQRCRYFRGFDYDEDRVRCLGRSATAVDEAANRHAK